MTPSDRTEPLHPVARELPPPRGRARRAIRRVERWDDWEEYDAAAWPRKVKRRYSLDPDHLLQLRGGVRAARLRRPGRRCRSRSSRATRCIRAAAGATAPRARPRSTRSQDPERILYPLRRVGARGGGEWERVTWDEVLDDIAGRIRKALVEGRPEGGHVPPRAAGPRARSTCSASSTPGASTATTATRTSARRARARATRSGTGSTGRRPTTPTRASSCSSPRTSRPGTTSTRTRSGSSRARCAGAKICVHRHAAVATRRRWRTAGCRPGRAPRPRCCSRCAHVLVRERPLRPRLRRAAGSTGRSTCARSGRTCR